VRVEQQERQGIGFKKPGGSARRQEGMYRGASPSEKKTPGEGKGGGSRGKRENKKVGDRGKKKQDWMGR